jgi:hypothetical protein
MEHKFSYAMIGERKSGKGTIQAAATSAFGAGIISSGFSANNFLGTDTTVDEAKKYMFLRDAGATGSRIVWHNEVRIVTPKGETFIDRNLIKGIASGGDPLTVRGNHQDPLKLRHEFTMFINVNDLPVTRPAIGNSMLRIIHPNPYVKDPKKLSHKLADPGSSSKSRITRLPTASCTSCCTFTTSSSSRGSHLSPFPRLWLRPRMATRPKRRTCCWCFPRRWNSRSRSVYKESGHMLPATELKTIVENLKEVGKLKGCSLGGIATKVTNNGYPKKRARFNSEDTKFYVGLKVKHGEEV